MLVAAFSEMHIEQARSEGRSRTAASRAAGHVPYFARPAAAQVHSDFIGRLCELLGGQIFALAVTPVSAPGSPDLRVMDVRGRAVAPERPDPDLPIRLTDAKNLLRPQVLIRVSVRHLRAQVAGWLLPAEAIALAIAAEANGVTWWDAYTRCWYVPGEYLHSVRSLRDWLDAGAPPHASAVRPEVHAEIAHRRSE
jgi:hypothetical protein